MDCSEGHPKTERRRNVPEAPTGEGEDRRLRADVEAFAAAAVDAYLEACERGEWPPVDLTQFPVSPALQQYLQLIGWYDDEPWVQEVYPAEVLG